VEHLALFNLMTGGELVSETLRFEEKIASMNASKYQPKILIFRFPPEHSII
jgi:hypothetical protein